MKRCSRIIIIALSIFCAATICEAREYFVITPSGFKKIPIGVPPLKGEKTDKQSGDMSGLLNKDLDVSGFFITAPASLIDKELLNEGVEKKEINFNNWRSMGIDLVCKGRIEAKDGDLALEAFLYDTLDGTLLLAKRYKGQQGDWRRLVHRLADDIVLTVTGEKGILSSRILFTSGVRNLKEVYMADFDGQNVKKLTSYRNIALSPSVSPEGKYLAYTSYKEGRANLYIKDIEKNTEVYADRSDGTKIGTSWLNKSTIVYSHTAGGHSTIYAYDVEKRDKKALLQQDGILASPKVSPDGKKMLFVSDMYGSPQIFARDNSSGATNRLTYYGTYNSAPAWSPKGDLIVFVSKLEGGFEISTINPDGSNQRVLTNDGAINDSPQFSPEGRYIIYSSQKGGKYGIHIMLFNGDNKRLLKFTDYNEEQPAFMP
jgi:TolB protein